MVTVQKLQLSSGRFQAIGETDLEHAFYLLLERLRPLWRDPGKLPALDDKLAEIAELATLLCGLGTANFLYSDGNTLIVHSHKRFWEVTTRLSSIRHFLRANRYLTTSPE